MTRHDGPLQALTNRWTDTPGTAGHGPLASRIGLRLWIALCMIAPQGLAHPQATAVRSGLCFDATLVHAARMAPLLPELPPGTELFPVVFSGGKTAFRIRSDLFRFASIYGGRDTLRDLMESAKARQMPVYPTIHLLRWAPPGTPAGEDLYMKRPDLFALDPEGRTGSEESGKKASPFNSEVRERLRQVAVQLANAYPEAPGLVVLARLSVDPLLGYDVAARVAFIRHASIDPIDAPAAITRPEDEAPATQWWQWRLDQMTQLVADITSAYRGGKREATIIAFGDAGTYEGDLRLRSRTAEDWLTWLAAGYVDRLILTGAWDDPRYEGVYGRALALIKRLDRPVPVQVLIPLGQDDASFRAQLAALRAQAEVPGVVIDVDRASDLPRAVNLLKELP